MVTGTFPGACLAAAMTQFLNADHIRIFAYPQFAAPVHDRVRENAGALAAEAGITIEYIAKTHVRKEAVVATVPERRTRNWDRAAIAAACHVTQNTIIQALA